jgi:hypothetical protein
MPRVLVVCEHCVDLVSKAISWGTRPALNCLRSCPFWSRRPCDSGTWILVSAIFNSCCWTYLSCQNQRQRQHQASNRIPPCSLRGPRELDVRMSTKTTYRATTQTRAKKRKFLKSVHRGATRAGLRSRNGSSIVLRPRPRGAPIISMKRVTGQ